MKVGKRSRKRVPLLVLPRGFVGQENWGRGTRTETDGTTGGLKFPKTLGPLLKFSHPGRYPTRISERLTTAQSRLERNKLGSYRAQQGRPGEHVVMHNGEITRLLRGGTFIPGKRVRRRSRIYHFPVESGNLEEGEKANKEEGLSKKGKKRIKRGGA